MFDVFLSHNRQHKPWVKNLYHFLIKNGLNVFFDEQSIKPGGNIVSSIETAIVDSKYVILVLTPSSVNSKWVAMETLLSVHDDPDGCDGKLIPVVLEAIDYDKLRPSIKALNCIELTLRETREERLRYILRHIGVPDVDCIAKEDILAIFNKINAVDSYGLQLGDLNTVLEWGWDGIRLLDAFIDLDYQTLEDLVDSHEGHSGQWAPIFLNHPDTWRMLTVSPEIIAGYWHFVPLFPHDYNLAKDGVLLDSQITGDKIQFFEFPGWYDIYFVQVCLLPQYKKLKNVQFLFESIFDVLDSLSINGIYVREICANAYTDVGKALCKTFNFKFYKEHSEHGSIYVGSVYDVLQSSLAKKYDSLCVRYQEKNAD
jgi:hypothetical protein